MPATALLSIAILAAGQGTRMRSSRPKVLHQLAGKPLLEHVYHAAASLAPRAVTIVYGHGGDQVPRSFEHFSAHWVEQPEQLGTGHAVACALPGLSTDDLVLILYGDVPLITPATLQRLVTAAQPAGFSLLTCTLDEPGGYGRILRDGSGEVLGIIEHRDADAAQRQITEINTGMMAVRGELLQRWINALDNRNHQGEYYLTDIVAMAVSEGIRIATIKPESTSEILGVNDLVQLAQAERSYQHRQALYLMQQGVTLPDPARFDLRGSLQVGKDAFIDVNVILEGEVSVGDEVRIGANCVIRNTSIGNGVIIEPNCVIVDAIIGNHCRVGPFARIRPETRLQDGVHIGNFVEIKKSNVATGARINHLSYIGDSDIGSQVNIGAGTITCNYDGANKHRTVIEDNVFVGSDTQLIAPVRVAAGATIAAGTTVSKDVPAGSLAIDRGQQKHIPNWQRPQKK